MCTSKMLEDYVEASKLEKQFKARKDELKVKIIEGMGESLAITKGHYVAKISHSERSSVKGSDLKVKYPEIFEQLVTFTDVVTLKVKEI